MSIKEINGHKVDEKFLYPRRSFLEIDKGLSWKPIETPTQEPKVVIQHFTCSYDLRATIGYFHDAGVSVHFVIGKHGEIAQMSPCNMRCAHAGASEWDLDGNGKIEPDERDLNRISIGIEVVNLGPLEKKGDKFFDCWNREYRGEVRQKKELGFEYWEPFTDSQEAAVDQISFWACKTFGISPSNVVDHAEVAPRRKNDPGASSKLTGPEYREYLRKRLHGDNNPYMVKIMVKIYETQEAFLRNPPKPGEKAYIRIPGYGDCVVCQMRKPIFPSMVCEDCHRIPGSFDIVK